MEAATRNHEAAKNALLRTIAARSAAESGGRQDDVQLLNVCQFALLANLDLSCLLQDLLCRRGTWFTKLHTRHLILLLFEATDDLTSVLGKDFRALVRRISAEQETCLALDALHGELVAMRNSNYAVFAAVRRGVVAHREHDAAKQIALLRQLDVEEVRSAAMAFLDWVTRLHALVGRIMQERHRTLGSIKVSA